MDADRGRKPLLGGRAVVRIEDFCRRTGLDRATVGNLMRAGQLRGGLWRDEERTRPMGIFEDALPTRDALPAMGLSIRDDDDPEARRSYEVVAKGDRDAQ